MDVIIIRDFDIVVKASDIVVHIAKVDFTIMDLPIMETLFIRPEDFEIDIKDLGFAGKFNPIDLHLYTNSEISISILTNFSDLLISTTILDSFFTDLKYSSNYYIHLFYSVHFYSGYYSSYHLFLFTRVKS